MDLWVICTFWILWIMLPCTLFYKAFVWMYIFNFLGTYIPRTAITGSDGCFMFNILRNRKLFSTEIVLFSIPTSNIWGCQLLLLNLGVLKGKGRDAQRWPENIYLEPLQYRKDWGLSTLPLDLPSTIQPPSLTCQSHCWRAECLSQMKSEVSCCCPPSALRRPNC